MLNVCAYGDVNLDSSDSAMTSRFCHVELNLISEKEKAAY